MTYSRILTDCVEHTQKGDKCGYGMTRQGGRAMGYHRAVFLRTHGYLPEVVMHTCDNPRCINPEHLLPGNQSLNIQDAYDKGRHRGSNRMFTDQQEKGILSELISGSTQLQVSERLGCSVGVIQKVVKRGVLRDQIQVQGTKRHPEYVAGRAC